MKSRRLASAVMALVMTAAMPMSTAASIGGMQLLSQATLTASAADNTSAINNDKLVVRNTSAPFVTNVMDVVTSEPSIINIKGNVTLHDVTGDVTQSVGSVLTMSFYKGDATISAIYERGHVYLLELDLSYTRKNTSTGITSTESVDMFGYLDVSTGQFEKYFEYPKGNTGMHPITFDNELKIAPAYDEYLRFFPNSQKRIYRGTSYDDVCKGNGTEIQEGSLQYGIRSAPVLAPADGVEGLVWGTGSVLSVSGGRNIVVGRNIWHIDNRVLGSFLGGSIPYVSVTKSRLGRSWASTVPAGATISSNSDYITSVLFLDDFAPDMTLDFTDVTLVENNNVKDTLSLDEFIDCSDKGIETNRRIPADTKSMWFMILNRGDGTKVFYKLDTGKGRWDKRIDTRENPSADVYVNADVFPDECAGGEQYHSKSNKGVYGDVQKTWSLQDFNNGDTTLTLPDFDKPNAVLFDYGKHGGAYYEYVGIDPVLVSAYGDRAKDGFDPKTSMTCPTNGNAGDSIKVIGTDEDGNKIEFTYTLKEDGESVPTGDIAEGIIIDETTGIYDKIVDGKPDTGDVFNLVNPEDTSGWTLTDKKGEKEIAKGNLDGINPDEIGSLIDDLGMQSKQVSPLEKASDAYYLFNVSAGENNKYPMETAEPSTYAVRLKKDTDTVGDVEVYKLTGVVGDVNLDGEFTVADIVLEQQWLLAMHNDDGVYGFANFVASNLCADDRADVFDLCLLKRELLKQSGYKN